MFTGRLTGEVKAFFKPAEFTCFVAALRPHGAADSPHAGQFPQAESRRHAPDGGSLETTGEQQDAGHTGEPRSFSCFFFSLPKDRVYPELQRLLSQQDTRVLVGKDAQWEQILARAACIRDVCRERSVCWFIKADRVQP